MKKQPRMNYEQKKFLTGKLKYYGLTLLCCLPVLLVLGYFVQKYLGDAMQIFVSFVILCVAFAIAWVIDGKKQKQQEQNPPKKDVFK
ncbi:MAG: hypothetical protein ACLRFG_01890 [Clostridia bacterium]